MLKAKSLRFSYGGFMLKRIFIILASVIAIIALICTFVISSFAASFNRGNYYVTDEQLFNKAREEKSTVYYAYGDGGSLVEVFNTSRIVGREWIMIDKMGENIKKAFISAEDREYYRHHGVNVKRTAGAIVNYFLRTKSSFGASTITQQVIKNISGNNEQSAKRKFNEILRAVHLEKIYGKDEILEVYLNIVPMSGNMYGVSAASRAYFNKEPSDLTLWEAATITGITNSPSRYDPYRHPKECVEKRNRVLYAMLDNNAITTEEYNDAISRELEVKDKDTDEEIYSWFIEAANEDIVKDLANKNGISRPAALLLLRGCKIILTEDVAIQGILEEYFENTNNFSSTVNDGLNYSMVVTNNQSGDIVGLVGGVGRKGGNNLLNLAHIKIPPASTLKPLAIYAPMIDCGMINCATVIDDTPLSIKSDNGRVVGYPINSPNVYAGLTTVSDAIRLSKNTVAAKLLVSYGYERCANELIDRFGFDILKEVQQIDGRAVTDMGIAPLALGQLTRGVSIRELTDAYAAFVREGVVKRGNTYQCVFDYDGKIVITPDNTEKRIFKTETARIMNQLLSTVVDSGTAKHIKLKELVDTAGKTGTSSLNYDRLFVGYTPYYTAGIWTGYPSRANAVNGVSPSHIAIWDDIMLKIHSVCVFNTYKEPIGFSTLGLEKLPYCKDSGLTPSEICSCDLREDRVTYGYFAPNNVPRAECTTHREVIFPHANNVISAPYIEREFVDGLYVADEEYNYRKIAEAIGFNNEE